MAPILKEVGTVTMTLEGLEKIEELLAKQVAKDKKRIQEYDAKNFIFFDEDFKA
jgi:hypothetical protein